MLGTDWYTINHILISGSMLWLFIWQAVKCRITRTETKVISHIGYKLEFHVWESHSLSE